MDVSYCVLPFVLLLVAIVGAPLTYAAWPYLQKAGKYVFTDHPMTLGSLFSIALVALLMFSGRAVVGNVRLVSCGDSATVAKAPQTIQMASICTCGCGRHK